MGDMIESPAQARQRERSRRTLITIGVVTLLLFFAFWYAYSYYKASDAARAARSAQPTCVPARPGTATPETTTVNVYNASNRNGLAASTAKKLKAEGFSIGAITNEKGGRKVGGVAEIRYGTKGRGQMVLLQSYLGQRGKGVRTVHVKRGSDVVDLVLGAKFSGVNAPTLPSGATPTCQPSPSSSSS